jgi:hypothetical protein
MERSHRLDVRFDGLRHLGSAWRWLRAQGRSAGTAALCVAATLLTTACGGGGQEPGPSPLPVDTTTRTRLVLDSEAGDGVGAGATLAYTQADARFEVLLRSGVLELTLFGDQHWQARFRMAGQGPFVPGTYSRLAQFDPAAPAAAGLDVRTSDRSGDRACERSESELTIVSISAQALGGDVYSVNGLELRFTQRCEGQAGVLRGHLVWNRTDPTKPPAPSAVPAGLWQAPAGALPVGVNQLYLHSEPGETLGQGSTLSLGAPTHSLFVQPTPAGLSVSTSGPRSWTLSLSAPWTAERIVEGYYGPLRSRRLVNPARGTLLVRPSDADCEAAEGWVAVDRIRFDGQRIVELRLRFEQRCNGGSARLFGQLQWVDPGNPLPPGPADPPPGNLWRADTLPATGNVLVLEGGPGRPGFASQQRSFTRADALFSASALGSGIDARVSSDRIVELSFSPMEGLDRLRAGYYAGIGGSTGGRTGSLSVRVDGESCAPRDSWFVVDRVVYDGAQLREVELRFEHLCESGGAVLRGHLRWSVDNPAALAGPQIPPPAGLWAAPAGTMPATGNAAVIVSEPGDPVGGGATVVFTNANALLEASARGTSLSLAIRERGVWSVGAEAMAGQDRLRPGYYAPATSPGSVLSELFVARSGSTPCAGVRGWFVIDRLDYVGGQLQALELRLEQRCPGAAGALRLHARWTRDDSTGVAGPQQPPPAGLWQPPAGVFPSAGNAFYVEGDPGEPLTGGLSSLVVPPASMAVSWSGRNLSMVMGGGEWWGEFLPMEGINPLQPGHYPDLGANRPAAYNPRRGALTWQSSGRSCPGAGDPSFDAWVVVDEVRVVDGRLEHVDLRFAHRCPGSALWMRGRLRWTDPLASPLSLRGARALGLPPGPGLFPEESPRAATAMPTSPLSTDASRWRVNPR